MSRLAGQDTPLGIEGLARLLKQVGLDFDAENLADWLWLALQVGGEASLASPEAADRPEQAPAASPDVQIRQSDAPPPGEAPFSLRLPGPSQQAVSSGGRSLPFQAPAAPALRESLALGRLLRPLMQKMPSRQSSILDEEATASQTAERKFCMPVLRPAPERWLELVLLVEELPSTQIWKDIIDDFQRLVERQGAFRDVRTWSLRVDAQGQPGLYSRRYLPSHKQRPCRPNELRSPSGRRLILLVSDCSSVLWKAGPLLAWLKLWSQDSPVSILQLLPPKLWERSVLGQGLAAQFGAFSPGVPNAQLVTEALPVWESIHLQTALKIPVVTLEPDSMLEWARLVAGAGNARSPGVVFEEPFERLAEDDPPASTPAALAATERVARFHQTASPLARRLAGMLSVVPLSPQVISLVQATLLPASRQSHIAEILLSGLVEPVSPSAPGAASYQFVAGVREALWASVPRSDWENVRDAVADYIAAKAGIAIRSFATLLTLPDAEKEEAAQAVGDLLQEFTRLTRQQLRQFGGQDYQALLNALEGDLPTPAPALRLPSGWPPIQLLTFEFATIEFPPPPEVTLDPFTFETATLNVIESQQSRRRQSQQSPVRIEIVRATRQAFQWLEDLPNDAPPLEMVSIPGGTFLMGSPAEEPERRASEDPQHEVSVAPFLMSKFPITQAQWRAVAALPEIERKLNPDPSYFKGDQRPVEQVSWDDAAEFCRRLSAHTGRPYRLPSEAEWEYACRAGTTTPFHFGETITTDLANYDGDSTYRRGPTGVYRKETTEVGCFPANAFGLCDMHGNVWEWCADYWHENYEGAPSDGSAWLRADDDGAPRVLRGGSWNLNPRNCRSACRNHFNPRAVNSLNGFRVVCVVPRILP